jgi:hypothetical protein
MSVAHAGPTTHTVEDFGVFGICVMRGKRPLDDVAWIDRS